MAALHVVVMGVSGSGKSTVGALLAQEIGATFIDGDDLHPEANVAKMAAGKSLDDADRKPWLEKIVEGLVRAREKSLVLEPDESGFALNIAPKPEELAREAARLIVARERC